MTHTETLLINLVSETRGLEREIQDLESDENGNSIRQAMLSIEVEFKKKERDVLLDVVERLRRTVSLDTQF